MGGCNDKLLTCDPITTLWGVCVVFNVLGLLSFSMLSICWYLVNVKMGQCFGSPYDVSLLIQRGGFRAFPEGFEETLLFGFSGGGGGGSARGSIILAIAILSLGGTLREPMRD